MSQKNSPNYYSKDTTTKSAASKSPTTSKLPARKLTTPSKSAATYTPATSSTSITFIQSSRVEALKNRYKNIRVLESYLQQESDLKQEDVIPTHVQTDLDDTTALVANISEELQSTKGDLKTLMEINTAFSTENDKLKRRIKENKGNSAKDAHLPKKVKGSTKGKKVISDNEDDDDKEEPINEKSARVR
ncbi:hypothetical protein RclHR1_08640003 [Rhizophagus clarus]|uniref:Uncharacterized protein n=1 Tax=Rhizophagus clarus TaxID=94130 RepID=A0A2Z6S3W8_9GLOM|nr:hypothetical protein RclHR1_08640003 [Rhizophagus clarus]